MTTHDQWASSPTARVGPKELQAFRPDSALSHLIETPAEPVIQRLLVLVPDVDLDPSSFAAQIRALAQPKRLGVLLVGQCPVEADEWHWRRSLATLGAAISDTDHLLVETQVSLASSWLDIVKGLRVDGDLVVCHREQVLRGAWPWQRQALDQALIAELRQPVCVLEGLVQPLPNRQRPLAARVLDWVVPLAVIVAFAVLQVQIRTNVSDTAGMVLLSLSTVIELVLLAVWVGPRS